jgi:hypothetical protein
MKMTTKMDATLYHKALKDPTSDASALRGGCLGGVDAKVVTPTVATSCHSPPSLLSLASVAVDDVAVIPICIQHPNQNCVVQTRAKCRGQTTSRHPIKN